MSTHRSCWRYHAGLLGLLIILAACGGTTNQPGGTGTTTTTPRPATNATSNPGNTTNPPTTSTVTFTASGGLTGPYTISDNDRGSNYGKPTLSFILSDKNWRFFLSYNGYSGPATYTLKFTPASPPMGSVTVQSADGTKTWRLAPDASCQLTVDSDTLVPGLTGNAQYHEVKGHFTCPTLTSSSTSSSITLTNGQFDIIALVVPA